MPNKQGGVLIEQQAKNNVVGGLNSLVNGVIELRDGNVISGNSSSGIHLSGTNTSSNVIGGNLIGTSKMGSGPVEANGSVQTIGVLIDQGASGNTIGRLNQVNEDGTVTRTDSNVISGNSNFGVEISGNGTTDNTVMGNYIGTDKNGVFSVGNETGVFINNAASNRIGGTDAELRKCDFRQHRERH